MKFSIMRMIALQVMRDLDLQIEGIEPKDYRILKV